MTEPVLVWAAIYAALWVVLLGFMRLIRRRNRRHGLTTPDDLLSGKEEQ